MSIDSFSALFSKKVRAFFIVAIYFGCYNIVYGYKLFTVSVYPNFSFDKYKNGYKLDLYFSDFCKTDTLYFRLPISDIPEEVTIGQGKYWANVFSQRNTNHVLKNDTIVIIRVIPFDARLYSYRSEIEFVGKEKTYQLSLDVNSAAVFISQCDIKVAKIDTIDLNKKKCPFGNIIMFDSYSDSNLSIYHKTDSTETLIAKKGGFPGETVFFDFGKVPKGLYKALYLSDYGPIVRWVKN